MARSLVEDVLKYVVLPFVGVVVIVYFVMKLVGAVNPYQQAGEQLGRIWYEYDREYEDFLSNDGTIDTNEQAILESKMELMRPVVQGLANSIPNPTEIAAALAIVLAAAVIAYKALKGEFNIGSRLRQFLDNLKPQTDPNTNQLMTFSTAEEMAMISRLIGIMSLADAGFTGLASTALTVEQSNYFNIYLPKMQQSYNLLQAQLPNLIGMELAMAQYLMSQYNIYLIAYTTTLPPIFTLAPPI